MPRLLIVSRSSNPLGGADRIIADLCRELPQSGWNVDLGLTVGAKFNRVEPYRELHGDLPIFPIDGTMGTQKARVNAIRKAIKELKPDVVLTMRVYDAYQAVAIQKQQGQLVRFAVGIRGYEAPYVADLRRFEPIVDYCITSGELIVKVCTDWARLSRDRVVSIGGGVHLPSTKVTPRCKGSRLRLLYAGRLEEYQKRVADVVPLLKNLRKFGIPFELDIAGSGPSEASLRSQLEEEIEDGSVKFHDWVSKEQLYENLYPRADLFLHFAAWEGVTIAPREAMAHGVVPVISRFVGLTAERHIIHEHNALVFPIGRPDLAALEVKRLWDDPELLAKLSANASQSQSGKYTYDGSIEAWHTALSNCLALPQKRAQVHFPPPQVNGVLTNFGLPGALQEWLRHRLNRPVQHGDPGSEWPTSSGRMASEDQDAINEFAKRVESCGS